MAVVIIDDIIIEETEPDIKPVPTKKRPSPPYSYVKKFISHKNDGPNNGNTKLHKIPGYTEFFAFMKSKTDSVKVNRSDNYEREYKKAKPMVEKLSEKLDLPEMAAEALLDTIAVMRSATTSKDKLSAAKQVLEFTMAKPVAKSEVKVSTAEDWLKSLVDDN